MTPGDIRKITYGDPKEGFTYTVGQSIFGGKCKITSVVRDENNHRLRGDNRYSILISNPDNIEAVWKVIENQPVVVEYEI